MRYGSIQPRELIGVPEPPSTRPKVSSMCELVIVHYTGMSQQVDSIDSRAAATAVARFGAATNRPWEYNYMVGNDGAVWEQGGPYRAAHCTGWNGKSLGVLFLLGVGQEPSRAALEAFSELLEIFTAYGALDPVHTVGPHRNYGQTSCPGVPLWRALTA